MTQYDHGPLSETWKEGDLLLLTTGEYSDYFVHYVGRVLKAFDEKTVVLAYLKLYPEQAEDYSGKEEQFLSWLIEQGYLEELEKKEFHFSNYSNFSWKPEKPAVP